MRLVVDDKIRKIHGCSGFIRKNKPKIIVIHATAGGNTYAWMSSKTNERRASYKKGIGLFHYLIEKNSDKVIEIIDPERWTYHSHSGSADSETIGIEIEKYDPTNMISPSIAQYNSLGNLIYKLCMDYPITRIESHRYRARFYSGFKRWACPMTFDLNKVVTFLAIKGLIFKAFYPYSDDAMCWVLVKSNSKDTEYDGKNDGSKGKVVPLERDWHVSGNLINMNLGSSSLNEFTGIQNQILSGRSSSFAEIEFNSSNGFDPTCPKK